MANPTNSEIAGAAPPGPRRRHGGFGTPMPRWARVVVASVLAITAASSVITHDLLMLWNTQTRLRMDAVDMAAAGVKFLPGAPARAMRAAANSAALCGLSPSEVVQAEAASDGMSFKVTLRRMPRLLVLQLLVAADVDVTATIRVRQPAAPRPPDGADGAPMVLSMLKAGKSEKWKTENLKGLKTPLASRYCGGRQF